MVESSDEPSLLDRIRSSARRANAHASHPQSGAGDQPPALPLNHVPAPNDGDEAVSSKPWSPADAVGRTAVTGAINGDGVAEKASSTLSPPAPPPAEKEYGKTPSTIGSSGKRNIVIRFYHVLKETLLSSYLNILLVFVPVAIACHAAGINPTVVFAMNAIAIVPLAGLLSYATESAAAEMGDTIGALMNVTFGNAVELIILYVFLRIYAPCGLLIDSCSMYVQIADNKTKESQRRPSRHLQLDCVPCSLPLLIPVSLRATCFICLLLSSTATVLH